jgi:hypothetical protein
MLLAACAPAPLSGLYQPGAREIFLWRSESIPLEPGWRLVGTQKITVRGRVWNSNLTPADEVQTLIFAREGQDKSSILLLSRVAKIGTTEIFSFLGGTKALIQGLPYREARYGLASDTTDPEYRRYFEAVREAGLVPAPTYSVRILDRLPLDTALVRIMELTPADVHADLPSFGKLYPQEKLEVLPRPFF